MSVNVTLSDMKVRLGVMETKRITDKPAVGGKQGRRGEDGRRPEGFSFCRSRTEGMMRSSFLLLQDRQTGRHKESNVTNAPWTARQHRGYCAGVHSKNTSD